MPSKSKSKGNSCEREVASKLSSWWNAEFLRTPNSGGLRWHGKLWTYGDLNVPEDFPGIIECKFYKEIDLGHLIHSPHSRSDGIYQWWYNQLNADQERCYKETGLYLLPILIFKKNRSPLTICLDFNFFQCLAGRPSSYLKVELTTTKPFILTSFTDFSECISKQMFLEAYRDWESCVVDHRGDDFFDRLSINNVTTGT